MSMSFPGMSQKSNQALSESRNFIHIDSKDRSYGSASNFTITVNDLLINNRKLIAVDSVIIPNSFYAINSNNNTFQINGSTVTLALGNYSIASFITELQTKIIAAIGGTCVITYSGITGKLTFTTSLGTSLTSNTRNYRYLGLSPSDTKLLVSGILETPFPVDIGSTRYIDVILDNTGISSTNSSNRNQNVLARIYNNTSSFGTIYFRSSDFDFISLGGDRLNSVSLRLVDDNSDVLELNGLQWSITLKTRVI